jgi:hypothetical protein
MTMNILIGFGQHHVDKTELFARKIASAALDGADEKEIEKIFLSEGVFDGQYRNARLRRFHRGDDAGATITVVYGTYSHYRKDHPLSPDGWAMWDIPFCTVSIKDDIWGDRIFVMALDSEIVPKEC